MRFVQTPRRKSGQRADELLLKRTLRIVKLKSFDIGKEACVKRIYSLYAEHIENKTFNECDDRCIIYLNRIAEAYAYFIFGATGWKVGYFVNSERDVFSDGFGVASPDNEYILCVLTITKRSWREKKDYFVEFYERIKSGNLPHAKPNEFLLLWHHFYENPVKEEYCPFNPLGLRDFKQWHRFVKIGAELLELPLDENGFPKDRPVEEIIKMLEDELSKSKPDYDESSKLGEAYLRSMAAIYGQCVRAVAGFEIGRTWDETDEGIEGEVTLYTKDKHFWFYPYAVIYRELTSRKQRCDLMSHFQLTLHLPEPDGKYAEELKIYPS